MKLRKKLRGLSLPCPPAHLLPRSPAQLEDPRQREALHSSETPKPGSGSSPRGQGEGLPLLMSQARPWPRHGGRCHPTSETIETPGSRILPRPHISHALTETLYPAQAGKSMREGHSLPSPENFLLSPLSPSLKDWGRKSGK